jgi:hypothetical protein
VAERRSFLKKRTKKLYEFGFGLAGKAAAKQTQVFLLLFFQESRPSFPSLLPCAVPPPQSAVTGTPQ